jgi:lysophospholipase L1-like esterase
MCGDGFICVKTVLAVAAGLALVAGVAALAAEKAAEPPAKPESVLAQALKLVPAAPADSPKEPILKAEDKVVAIGDSITQQAGYVKMINAALAQSCPDLKIPPVINVGISGQKAEDLVKRFDKDVVQKKPAAVTLSIGINDVWHRLKNPADPKVLAAYKENVAKMVDLAQAANIKPILLAPTVIQEDPATEGNQRLTDYVEAMKSVAAEKKCAFVDLHGMFLEALKKKPADTKGNWLTADGVHMKPLGDAIMAIGALRALGLSDEKIAAADPAKKPEAKK